MHWDRVIVRMNRSRRENGGQIKTACQLGDVDVHTLITAVVVLHMN